jgi:hypothetical protein
MATRVTMAVGFSDGWFILLQLEALDGKPSWLHEFVEALFKCSNMS